MLCWRHFTIALFWRIQDKKKEAQRERNPCRQQPPWITCFPFPVSRFPFLFPSKYNANICVDVKNGPPQGGGSLRTLLLVKDPREETLRCGAERNGDRTSTVEDPHDDLVGGQGDRSEGGGDNVAHGDVGGYPANLGGGGGEKVWPEHLDILAGQESEEFPE